MDGVELALRINADTRLACRGVVLLPSVTQEKEIGIQGDAPSH
ncbi:MAG: hypothetical protein ACT4OL_01980 [Nitrospiraceae bacterium]